MHLQSIFVNSRKEQFLHSLPLRLPGLITMERPSISATLSKETHRFLQPLLCHQSFNNKRLQSLPLWASRKPVFSNNCSTVNHSTNRGDKNSMARARDGEKCWLEGIGNLNRLFLERRCHAASDYYSEKIIFNQLLNLQNW